MTYHKTEDGYEFDGKYFDRAVNAACGVVLNGGDTIGTVLYVDEVVRIVEAVLKSTLSVE